jgi:hypothetical protein
MEGGVMDDNSEASAALVSAIIFTVLFVMGLLDFLAWIQGF